MRRIRTFPQFIMHVILLIIVILAVVAGVIMILSPLLSIRPLTFLTNPQDAMSFVQNLMQTDFFKITVFPGFTFVVLFAAAMILWERKFLAKIQLRVGPLYAGRLEGILQPIADVLKLLFKELITPRDVDRLFFWAAPTAAVVVATAGVAVIPVSEYWVIAPSNVGLLIVFAVISFSPITVLLAAWASNSKYPLIGGLRALHQMVSYEIPLILSSLGVVLMSGSLDLITIVKAQSNVWFILPSVIGAFTFFVCAMAELDRIPFDMPEAESEIVTGWLTEYSGMNYGLVYGIAAYIKFYVMAGLFTTLFLGGWNGPPPIPKEVWFILKTFIVSTVFIIPRGVYPRIRIDLMLRKGWAFLIFLSILNIIIAIFLIQFGIVRPGGLL